MKSNSGLFVKEKIDCFCVIRLPLFSEHSISVLIFHSKNQTIMLCYYEKDCFAIAGGNRVYSLSQSPTATGTVTDSNAHYQGILFNQREQRCITVYTAGAILQELVFQSIVKVTGAVIRV